MQSSILPQYYCVLIKDSTPTCQPTVRIGDIGSAVAELQRFLVQVSTGTAVKVLQRALVETSDDVYYACQIDGVFVLLTDLAVRQFQHRAGLEVDGVVGSKTWNALSRAMPSVKSQRLLK